MRDMYIGIDLGTSSVKILLVDGDGRVIRSASRKYPLYFPQPGWSEQNPCDWYEQTIAGLKELILDVDKSAIQGISFGGQMHGLVLLDANDQVIRPAILWNDGRTSKENEYLNETIGRKKLTELTANISFTGFTASKILWVKENEPDNFNKIHKIMLPKDYLAYRLTGVHSTDYSDASGTLLLDVKKKCWSKEMCQICHVDEAWLPQLFESFSVIGTVKKEVAQILGIGMDVKVIAGAGDNAAAAVGTGTIGEGGTTISVGTSGTVFISSKEFVGDDTNALHAFAHADGGYHLMGCMLSAASANRWWLEDIIGSRDYSGAQEEIKKLGENGVYFLPYLMGERSPLNDPFARGTFVGMSMDTTKVDMYQAVLEGVAFALRQSVDVARKLGINVLEAKICGGGAKSPLWRKIIANVLNVTLLRPECEEGPSYGAAILAMVGCGKYDSVSKAVDKLIRNEVVEEPKTDLVEKYNQKYNTFIKIYPALKGVYRELCQKDSEG